MDGYINFHSNGEVDRVVLDSSGNKVDPNGNDPYPSTGSWSVVNGDILIDWWYEGYHDMTLQIKGTSLEPGANTCYTYNSRTSCSTITKYETLSI